MKIMIDTRVPICPKCSGTLDKGFLNEPGRYQGTYFFCVDCHRRFLIREQGQAENELYCEYCKEEENDR